MAQIQCTDVQPKIVTLPNCKNSIDIQQLKQGTIFVKPGDLKLEGNWKTHDVTFDGSVTFVELLESCTFKASGKCLLPNGKGPYAGHFVVGLSMDHNVGKVRTEKCPPQEKREKDLTKYPPGIMFCIELGVCDGETPSQLLRYVEFSLANAGIPTPQKGLFIYGVTFTPVLMK